MLNIDIKSLTEQEKALKKMYQTGERYVLSTPMPYAKYLQLIKEHIEYVDLRDFYEERTKDSQGNTIADVSEIESGEEISVQMHERYGYPILHNHVFVEIAYVYSGTCTHYVDASNDSKNVSGNKRTKVCLQGKLAIIYQTIIYSYPA